MGAYEDYVRAIRSINENLDPLIFLLLSLFLSSVVALYVGLLFDVMMGFLLAILVVDLLFGYFVYKAQRSVEEIEEKLPDVLMYISTSLQAGGTIESALREVAGGRYGPMAKEMRKMLLKMKEGKTFEEAFTEFAESTGSELIRRISKVIVSAKRAGGGLTTALMSIADDIRETHRIKKERIAKTTTPAMFMVIAADLVAPLIFGMVTGIMTFLAHVSGSSSVVMFNTTVSYLKIFLAISAIFSSLALAMIRDGKVSKATLYAPVLLLTSYIVYTLVSMYSVNFFGGG